MGLLLTLRLGIADSVRHGDWDSDGCDRPEGLDGLEERWEVGVIKPCRKRVSYSVIFVGECLPHSAGRP